MHPREKVDSLSGGICGTVICFPFMFINKWISIKKARVESCDVSSLCVIRCSLRIGKMLQ